MATVQGTIEDDLLRGTEDDDTILGRAGNDTAYGLGGADTFGMDSGNDRAFGGAGNDLIYGGDGDDDLSGEDGDDVLSGGAGADRLSGGAGADRLGGRDGDDDLRGGLGNDHLTGGAGNDYLDAGGGSNILYGEDGDDIMFVYSDDRVSAGNGEDLVSLYGYSTLNAVVSLGSDADTVTMEYAGRGRDFAGGGTTTITDFRHGIDQIGELKFVITDDDGTEFIDFAALDSNDDDVVDQQDLGVSVGDGRLTIDLAPALTELASVGRPDFEVTDPILLRFAGLKDLTSADFG